MTHIADNTVTITRNEFTLGKQHKRKGDFMGSGYVIPDGMSKAEFTKLYAEWNKKLNASGHIELERITPLGLASPFFASHPQYNSPNQDSNHTLRQFTQDKQDYYHFISVMAQHADFQTLFGYRHHKYLRWLADKTSEGHTLDTLLYMTRTYSRKVDCYKGGQNFKKNISRSKVYELQRQFLDILLDWHRSHDEGLMHNSSESESE